MAEDQRGREIEEVIVSLRTGRIAEALKQISCVSACVQEASRGRTGQDLKRFSSGLKEVIAGFQRKDYVYTADILEYELVPLLKEKK